MGDKFLTYLQKRYDDYVYACRTDDDLESQSSREMRVKRDECREVLDAYKELTGVEVSRPRQSTGYRRHPRKFA